MADATEVQEPQGGTRRGAGSFCIPRQALQALIAAQASAYDICAYLVLARFTDESGQFSTASISAVNRYTGANKVRGGPIDKAIQRLLTIRARQGTTDLGPILLDRETWCAQTGKTPLDGPHERAKVLFVLPDFSEPLEDRVWFGGNLVTGVGAFAQPLKTLKNAGPVAARLLLVMYAANDMETWGGVRPVGDGSGPWVNYERAAGDVALHGDARLLRAKREGTVGAEAISSRVWPHHPAEEWDEAHAAAGEPVYAALHALVAAGLVYEVVMVLNREADETEFEDGEVYGVIPEDAEPFYELDARTRHGYKPEGEEGIGGSTARTAGELGCPVTRPGGVFAGTYAAIVPQGFGAMIAGIYRLRFRVANTKNAGVAGAWARIRQNNREAGELVQRVRKASGLELLQIA